MDQADKNRLYHLIKTLQNRLDKKDQQIQDLYKALLDTNANSQRVNQAVGPLTAGLPQDVTVTWPAEWPEVVCAENPHFGGGSDQHIPTAKVPDF